MKRVLVFALLLAMSITVSSSAGVLSEGWDSSALDALIQAHQKLTTQIEKLNIKHGSQFEPILLSGDDKGSVKGVAIPFAPARIIVGGRVALTFKGQNFEKHIKHPEGFDKHIDVLTQSGVFDLEISHGYGNKQPWSLTIEPMTNVGFVKHSGAGAYFTDLFTLPKEASVRFIVTSKKMWNRTEPADLYLHYFDEEIDAWMDLLVSDGELSSSVTPHRYEDTVTIDQIKEGALCFWSIWTYPHEDWGIYPLK